MKTPKLKNDFLQKLANLGYYTTENLPSDLTEDGKKCAEGFDIYSHGCIDVYNQLIQMKIDCYFFFSIRAEVIRNTNITEMYLEAHTPNLIAQFNDTLVMFKLRSKGSKIWIDATNAYFNNKINESHTYYYYNIEKKTTSVEPNKIGINSISEKKVLQWLEYCDNMQKIRLQLHQEYTQKIATISKKIAEYVERAKKIKSFIRYEEYGVKTSVEFKLFYVVFTIDRQYASYVSQTNIKGNEQQILELLESVN